MRYRLNTINKNHPFPVIEIGDGEVTAMNIDPDRFVVLAEKRTIPRINQLEEILQIVSVCKFRDLPKHLYLPRQVDEGVERFAEEEQSRDYYIATEFDIEHPSREEMENEIKKYDGEKYVPFNTETVGAAIGCERYNDTRFHLDQYGLSHLSDEAVQAIYEYIESSIRTANLAEIVDAIGQKSNV